MWSASLFAGGIDAGVDPWLQIEELAAAWFERIRSGDGYPSYELDTSPMPVPGALRRFYEMAGRRHDLAGDDSLVIPSELLEDDGMVAFRWENQGNAAWGYRVVDAGMFDPPIYLHVDNGPWAAEAPSCTRFLLQMLASTAVLAGGHFRAFGFAEGRPLDELLADFVPIPFGEWHWPTYPTRWYGQTDTLVMTSGGDDVFLACRSADAFQRHRNLLPKWETWHPPDALAETE